MEEGIIAGIVLIGLPWLILHYVTKWKTAATITQEDEVLLEELYQLAKRLDERMDTVERLVATDNPDFKRPRVQPDKEVDNLPLHKLEKMLDKKEARK